MQNDRKTRLFKDLFTNPQIYCFLITCEFLREETEKGKFESWSVWGSEI
jgi:hypothetical protein